MYIIGLLGVGLGMLHFYEEKFQNLLGRFLFEGVGEVEPVISPGLFDVPQVEDGGLRLPRKDQRRSPAGKGSSPFCKELKRAF